MATLNANVDVSWWGRLYREKPPQGGPVVGHPSVNGLALGFLESDHFRGQISFDKDLRTYLAEAGVTLSDAQFELLAAHAFATAYSDSRPM